MNPLRILTWHVHGNYLYYLSQTPHEFYLPVGKSEMGYAGAAPGFPWSSRVHDVLIDDINRLDVDVILYQSQSHYLHDQYDILSDRQRRLPALFLEHDPPQEHPTNTRHVVDDPTMLLVHVTPFNELMWDSGRTPTTVIEHGVLLPEDARYTGELAKGLVVVNNLRERGRRLGVDIFQRVRREIPLDLAGMGSEELGGLCEISHDALPGLMCRYRFLFNPIRYTSLGLAVCEAMSLGVPIIGLATTEMATLVAQGQSGYVDTNIQRLIEYMRELLTDPLEARRLSSEARREGRRRFSIARFIEEWNAVLAAAVRRGPSAHERPRNAEPFVVA